GSNGNGLSPGLTVASSWPFRPPHRGRKPRRDTSSDPRVSGRKLVCESASRCTCREPPARFASRYWMIPHVRKRSTQDRPCHDLRRVQFLSQDLNQLLSALVRRACLKLRDPLHKCMSATDPHKLRAFDRSNAPLVDRRDECLPRPVVVFGGNADL